MALKTDSASILHRDRSELSACGLPCLDREPFWPTKFDSDYFARGSHCFDTTVILGFLAIN
jgi:hypothetical protein